MDSIVKNCPSIFAGLFASNLHQVWILQDDDIPLMCAGEYPPLFLLLYTDVFCSMGAWGCQDTHGAAEAVEHMEHRV